MESDYEYKLQEPDEPNLYRDVFPYSEIPKCTFNHESAQWILGRNLDHGHDLQGRQQSRAPYTPEKIVHIFKLLNKLEARRA
jgi:hypothetical protein